MTTPVTEARVASRVRAGRATVVLVLGALETMLFAGLIEGKTDARGFAVAHIGLCTAVAAIGLAWASRASSRSDTTERCATVLHWAGWTLLGGPFGTLMCAILLIPQRNDPPALARAAAIPSSLEPSRASLVHGRLLDRRVRIAGASRIEALFDVMQQGCLAEKFDALALVSKHYVAGMASVLRCALQDGDASVRVLAATVMARQHNLHTSRIGALQEAAAAQPGGWEALAKARLAYAHSGLLDGARADAETALAQRDLQRTEPRTPDER